jgi:hypothetical protein
MGFLRVNPHMKSMLNKYLLLVLLGFTIEAGASDRWETLRAINWVENPTNQTRAGRYGELGPYQFRPTTWRMHTDKPFRLAVERVAADEIAVKHYEWIKRSFEQAGVEPSIFNIAMAWNCGVDAVLSGRAPTVSYSYAERVSNLVEDFKRSQPAAVVAKAPAQTQSNPVVRFAVLQDMPRFEVVLPPPPEELVVHTDRAPVGSVAAAPVFVVNTTVATAPKFTLLLSMVD